MATSNNIISFRRHDLDNLRSGLTGLVIAHHTAVAYGGAGSWWKSALVPKGTLSPSLLAFNAFNQSFFMGLFFAISGRVSAQSLARADRSSEQGRWGFVRSKVLRLGLPALACTVTVQPLLWLAAAKRWDLDSLRSGLVEYFGSLRGVRGPVWYTATLLLFDLGAALLKPVSKGAGGHAAAIDYRTVARWGWPAVAGASFFVRLRYPVGSSIALINLQPAYAAQYIFAYALGHMWYDQEVASLADVSQPLLEGSKKDTGFKALGLPTATVLSLLPLSLLLYHSSKTDVYRIFGGWNLSALAYAVWNEASFAMMGPALLSYFALWHNEPTKSTIVRPRYSYAAFLVHSLVSVVVQVGIDGLILRGESRPAWLDNWVWKAVGPVVMTALVSPINIGASFGIGKALVDFVPGLSRIL